MTVATPRGARGAFHELSVAAIDRLTEDSAAVTFAVPDALRAAFDFRAGQSLTLRRTLDGVEHRRSYSICAPAGAAPRIGVREIPDGLFSAWLVRGLRVGDVVEVQTPSGSFRADPTQRARHLCIAAGSGITPMLSIVSSVLAGSDSQVTLLYGNRKASSVMFAEELADLKNRYGPRLDLVHVLSREPRDVELFSGRLDADRLRRLLTALVPLQALDHVWLCGPFGLISDARAVLAELGIDVDKVHYELFYVDEPPPELARPDTVVPGEVSQVTIVLDGRSSTAPMPRQQTILDAASASRSDLPFACKGGVCGTCRARVNHGEVDMRRNYALDDDEVARGFVLTCQTHPVSDRVEVDFDA
ncbi:phenylacetate-CoA oxygenase/reductase subunit PaaK [Jatrophihabitans telluris]|uniref:Phenylacetate-CoA oxygenase/reductase subunit PaaK n=1 Tax=Jatrophihabitans telluris TaxID=2038343 RepID=A0ABY4QT43_9ACTN|nr:1,2-phenylacetyl-CoA epoxidase subunit PaaE [Jatrophihabitans telluris]UQX86921.1 phenylacetate-CoA oxygenase/reductase subunit PaaK [Jatrophihabitans telluris]